MNLEELNSIKRSLEDDEGKHHAFCNAIMLAIFNRAHLLLFPLSWERPATIGTFFSLLEDIDSTMEVLKKLRDCVSEDYEVARQSRFDTLKELRASIVAAARIRIFPEFAELVGLRKLMSPAQLDTFMSISKTSTPTLDDCQTMRCLIHEARVRMRESGEVDAELDAWLEEKFNIYDGVLTAKGVYAPPLTALPEAEAVTGAGTTTEDTTTDTSTCAGTAAAAAGPSGLK